MANPSAGQSRLFLIVVVGLVGLLMIGLIAIAGLVVYTRFLAPSPTPPVVAGATATAVPTRPSAAPTPPTIVASPTTSAEEVPTATRVLQTGSPTPEGATPPPEGVTPSPGGPTPTATVAGGDEIPPTGFGPLEAFVGGIGLLLIIVLVRRLRLSSNTQ